SSSTRLPDTTLFRSEFLGREAEDADQGLPPVSAIEMRGHGGARVIEHLPAGAREAQLVDVPEALAVVVRRRQYVGRVAEEPQVRSEEHTSELQSREK